MTSGSVSMPERIGPYEIREPLGSGGMGVVYRGVSPAGEQVAVKQIRGYGFTDEDRARFAVEVEALKVAFGSRVVPYVDSDLTAPQPWLAIRYVPGATLRGYVGEHGPLEPVLAAILGAALAEGLMSIHEAGLLHRDLKPHNIILAHDGPMVIDFGLAVLTAAKIAAAERVTKPGMVVGTLVCMPPEQVRAEDPLTPAADVYALGATLLYAATGHYPFDAPTEYVLMTQISSPSHEPDLTGLAPVLHPSITAMLTKDPAQRPTLEQVRSMLVAVVNDAGLTSSQARVLLRRVTAANTPADPDTVAPEPSEIRDLPASWRTPRPIRRQGSSPSTTESPRGAVRAARRLRSAYARDAAL